MILTTTCDQEKISTNLPKSILITQRSVVQIHPPQPNKFLVISGSKLVAWEPFLLIAVKLTNETGFASDSTFSTASSIARPTLFAASTFPSPLRSPAIYVKRERASQCMPCSFQTSPRSLTRR